MKKIFDFGGNLMSLFLFQTCDMCLEQDDIFTFSTGKKVPKGQLSEADQKMCTRILFELYAKVRFLHMNLFVNAIIELKNICNLKQNIFFHSIRKVSCFEIVRT